MKPYQQKMGFLIMMLLVLLLVAQDNLTAVGQEAMVAGVYQGVDTAVHFDTSPPLHTMASAAVTAQPVIELPEPSLAMLAGAAEQSGVDTVVQTAVGANTMPAPIVSFDGPSNLANVSPPSPSGDVGPNHYVVMTHLYFAIYDKTGNLLLGPLANNALWAGFGGACQNDAGQPIVLYDSLADRWLLTQNTYGGPTYYNCVAVSTSGDPLGTYYRYAFSTGNRFPDSPHYAIWPDAYYISTREFTNGTTSIGVYAINRAQVLDGFPAPTVISFAGIGGAGDGLLPADFDGILPPPPGSPAYFVGSLDDGGPYGATQDALTLWKYHVDFVTPANSSFALTRVLPVASFNSIFPCSPGSRSCIPQPGTTNKVDILSYRQRLTWRLAYRNFGSHESLVGNQSVEADTNMAGIRWYEIRNPNSNPFVYQEGTYAPGVLDGIHRWMGSVAMDRKGNMTLGFSASSATTYPSVWYTGRLANDPLNTMPQGEGVIINGSGSQTGSQRWGNHSSMSIDPTDDCTFWYVNEYYEATSQVGWQTRIGAFKFPSCSMPEPPQEPTVFCNMTPITLPDSGAASVYPSEIMVAGLSTAVVDVNVVLAGLSHSWPDDLDLLLVGPQGQNLIVMSDVGGGFGVVDMDIKFDDEALGFAVGSGPLLAGTYFPTNDDGFGDVFSAPAPVSSVATLLTTFDGSDPNGMWQLYIVDDEEGDSGSLNGWCLEVTTLSPKLFLPFIVR